MQFQTRQVGRTNLKVTALGLGGATLAGNIEAVTRQRRAQLVIDAYDSGVRYFDTAPFYGYGRSEHIVGDGLRDREGCVLSTKVGRLLKPRTRPAAAGDDWRAARSRSSRCSTTATTRSCAPMRIQPAAPRPDHIDILYIHDPDVALRRRHRSRRSTRCARRSRAPTKALDALRSQGAVKAIGLGVNIHRADPEA